MHIVRMIEQRHPPVAFAATLGVAAREGDGRLVVAIDEPRAESRVPITAIVTFERRRGTDCNFGETRLRIDRHDPRSGVRREHQSHRLEVDQ